MFLYMTGQLMTAGDMLTKYTGVVGAICLGPDLKYTGVVMDFLTSIAALASSIACSST